MVHLLSLTPKALQKQEKLYVEQIEKASKAQTEAKKTYDDLGNNADVAIKDGEFGLGRNNLYYNQTDTDAMIDTDMVIPLHNKEADGLKYRLTLRFCFLTSSFRKILMFCKNLYNSRERI